MNKLHQTKTASPARLGTATILALGLVGLALAPTGSARADTAANHGNGAMELAPDVFGGYVSTHIMVKLQPGVTPVIAADGTVSITDQFDGLMRIWGVHTLREAASHQAANKAVARKLGLERWYRLEVPAGTDTLLMAADFSALMRDVEVAEIDGIGGIADIPDDQSFNLQYALHNTGQVIQGQTGVPDADVDAPEAWDLHTGNGLMTLAVIDSGVDDHPDFNGRLLVGWNTIEQNTNTRDGCPHGTHVAGIAGAQGNNGFGVAGANWALNILPVRVLTGCNGSTTNCADGIFWAVDNGADVGSMSLQYYTFSQYFEDSTVYAHDNNVLLIAAAGNNQGRRVSWPAKFEFCMGVSATNNQDNLAWFSNFGPEIDITGGGQDVYSTWVGNSYTYLSGTSMSAPLVSGLATLIWSYNPSLTADDVWNVLINTTDDLGPAGWDEKFGWGRVNIRAALLAGAPPMPLAVGPLVAGQAGQAVVNGATPNGTVYFALTFDGLGSTFVPILGVTLGLDTPRLVGSAQANSTGVATLSKTVNADMKGATIWIQALELGQVSNIHKQTVK